MSHRLESVLSQFQGLLDASQADPNSPAARWLKGQLPLLEAMLDGGISLDMRMLAHLYFLYVQQDTPYAEQLAGYRMQGHALIGQTNRFPQGQLVAGVYPVLAARFTRPLHLPQALTGLTNVGLRPGNLSECLALAYHVPRLLDDDGGLVELGTVYPHGPAEHFVAVAQRRGEHVHVDVLSCNGIPFPAGIQFVSVPLNYSLSAA